MHFPDRSTHRMHLVQAALFLVATVMILVGIAGFVTGAKAGPVTFTIDNGQASFGGGAFRNIKVLPANPTFPSDSLPLPQRTDIELNGTETDGALSFPASTNTGLQFPYMFLPHPLEDIRIPITMRLNEPGLTGTYDAGTGATTLEGSVDIIVITGTGTNFPLPDATVDAAVPPLGLFARCRISDAPVNFTTEDKFPFNGAPFQGGFGVNGSMSTNWNGLPGAVSENGGDCELVPLVTTSSGGLWFSNGIVEPSPQPPPPEPTCETAPRLCPDPPEAAITATSVTPKKRRVKVGKVVKLKVGVTNSGTAAATRVRVRIRSSNRKVKAPRVIKLNVPAGSKASKRIKVRVKRKAKGKAKITVNAEGHKSSTRLKIKKVARKKAKRRT